MFMRNVQMMAGDKYKEGVILGKEIPVDLIKGGKPRKHKEEISRPVQRNLNYRNAQKYFRLTGITNFVNGEYFGTYTFNDDHLPDSLELAEKQFRLYVQRVNRARKKLGLSAMKYMGVIEGKNEGRLHFHIIMDNLLDRDTLEELWSVGRGKNKESLGNVNIKIIRNQKMFGRLVPGIEVIATYLTKEFKEENRKGKRKWFSSKGNLKKPIVSRTQNYKYTYSMINKWIANNDVDEQLEKNNPDWELVEFERINPETGYKELVKHDLRGDDFVGVRLYYRMRRRI